MEWERTEGRGGVVFVRVDGGRSGEGVGIIILGVVGCVLAEIRATLF